MLSGSRSAALLALISSIVDARLRGTLLGIRAAAVNLGMAGFAGLGGIVYSTHGYPVLLSCAAVAVVVAWALIFAFVREGRER